MCFNVQQTKSLKSISKISGHSEEIMVTKVGPLELLWLPLFLLNG